MIITRTPLRISFVGGGTDLREYYKKETGTVLNTGINKYVYVILKKQIGIVEHKYRINWSQVEFKNDIDEINHPIVREVLRMFKIDFPVEITTIADIPAGTGLGSSSSFCVGLIHAVTTMIGLKKTKYELATLAAEVEVDILKRSMGKQDHFASAYGDLNVFTFNTDETISVEPVFYTYDVKKTLEKNMMLFYTGLKRDASEVLKTQNKVIKDKRTILSKMRDLVNPLREVLSGKQNMKIFGEILHQSSLLKKSISPEISNFQIDSYYEKACAAGAIGGKLLGAGGGGFLLIYARIVDQKKIIKALNKLAFLKFSFDNSGSRITYYDR